MSSRLVGDSYADWRGRFAQALDPRFFTIEHLDGLLSNERAFFIANEHAAIVVELKAFPTGAVAIAGVIAAGQLEVIQTILIPKAEQWGHLMGCQFSMIESRPGWSRQLKNSGYDVFQVSLVKEL